MKSSIATILVVFLTSSFEPVSLASSSVIYSPYADLTINTYWDSQYQDMEPMNLVKVSEQTGIKNYHLAFITDSGDCNAAWGGQSAYLTHQAWGKHLTDELRAKHISFVISFGGASGNDMSMMCTPSQLLSVYEQILTTYQPAGFDFDIENGTANIPKIIRTLTTFQNNHPTLTLSFTLPVMPEGLTNSGEELVKQAQAAHLNFTINIMTMDYGDAYRDDMGLYAIQAASHLFNFLQSLYPQKSLSEIWKMIEIT